MGDSFPWIFASPHAAAALSIPAPIASRRAFDLTNGKSFPAALPGIRFKRFCKLSHLGSVPVSLFAPYAIPAPSAPPSNAPPAVPTGPNAEPIAAPVVARGTAAEPYSTKGSATDFAADFSLSIEYEDSFISIWAFGSAPALILPNFIYALIRNSGSLKTSSASSGDNSISDIRSSFILGSSEVSSCGLNPPRKGGAIGNRWGIKKVSLERLWSV